MDPNLSNESKQSSYVHGIIRRIVNKLEKHLKRIKKLRSIEVYGERNGDKKKHGAHDTEKCIKISEVIPEIFQKMVVRILK